MDGAPTSRRDLDTTGSRDSGDLRKPLRISTIRIHHLHGIELAPKTWWVALYWLFFWVVLTVLSEEFVWRGYLLPLQEQAFGKWAWLLNGALWNIPFHLYTATAFFADMPFFLILPFLTQRLRNTWFAVSVHALLVSLAFVLILPGIFR